MNSIRIPYGIENPFPSCCYDCKHLIQSDDLQFTCGKGRIFPFKKNLCNVFESVRVIPKKRGGSRPGSGRKKIDNPKIKWSGYLSEDVVNFIKKSARDLNKQSQSNFIEDALRSFYNIVP